MAVGECSLESRPPTRHLRFKKVLILAGDEPWLGAAYDALEAHGYRMSLSEGPWDALHQLDVQSPDLLVVSASAGDRALAMLAEGLRDSIFTIPVLLVGVGPAEEVQDEWLFLTCLSVLRRPFETEDVLSAVAALLGSPYPER